MYPSESQEISLNHLFMLANMGYSIVETLMKRDGLERWEAEEIKEELRNQALAYLADGDMMQAMDIMYEVGLEPDYLDDLGLW